MRSTIKNRQSLLDLAITECGTFEAAFGLSIDSNFSLTDDVCVNTAFEVSPENVTKKQIVIRMKAAEANPATAVSARDMELVPYGGIGVMGIDIDFIVS